MSPDELAQAKEQLRKLKFARRTGAKRVITGDRDVTYKSDDDMRQAQRELEQEISDAEQGPGRRRRRSRMTLIAFRRAR